MSRGLIYDLEKDYIKVIVDKYCGHYEEIIESAAFLGSECRHDPELSGIQFDITEYDINDAESFIRNVELFSNRAMAAGKGEIELQIIAREDQLDLLKTCDVPPTTKIVKCDQRYFENHPEKKGDNYANYY